MIFKKKCVTQDQLGADVVPWIFEKTRGYRIFCLEGPLGAGKTTCVQQMAQYQGVKTAVASPTYGIVHLYETPRGNCAHMDLYRLQSKEMLVDIGFEELLETSLYTFIEWPQIALDKIKEGGHGYVHLLLNHTEDPQQRSIEMRLHPG